MSDLVGNPKDQFSRVVAPIGEWECMCHAQVHNLSHVWLADLGLTSCQQLRTYGEAGIKPATPGSKGELLSDYVTGASMSQVWFKPRMSL